jgi:hypothetical protein
MLDSIKAWFAEKMQQFVDWLFELLQWLPKKIFSAVFDGLAKLLEMIPVPDFITSAGSFFGGIDPGIAYVLNFLAVNEGLAMIISALILRFVLRRIPLIG